MEAENVFGVYSLVAMSRHFRVMNVNHVSWVIDNTVGHMLNTQYFELYFEAFVKVKIFMRL